MDSMKYLPQIQSPDDLKKLSVDEMIVLAEELRQELISVVSGTGGHLATNLGSVELTLALHYVYNLPEDKLVWDVSNQTYIHKMLTGRCSKMSTIRQHGGLAGFAKRSESKYDHFGAGHASTSISAALGFASARDNLGDDYSVVAIIGDGAMTGGLAYEGLNNAGSMKKDILVILNDNTWSISKNVGAMSRYLTSIMADEKFNRLRNEIWELTGRFKRRDKIRQTISRIEDSLKGLLVPGMLFEKLGFRYFGPIDGHDLELMTKTLQDLRQISGPVLLHVATTKGKGYDPAEGNPSKFHGVGTFDKLTGKSNAISTVLPSYTKVFGDALVEVADKDQKVVAVTAAMSTGTGLVEFSEKYPDRFYDVGIAEEHAGTFVAGLSAGGVKPYLVVYSTFMQRAYDMLIHDIALQDLPVVICMDRAGLVGADGPTHHGVFDLSFMRTIPNAIVVAPKDGDELRAMINHTINLDFKGPLSIRYPRGTVPTAISKDLKQIEWGKWERLGSASAPVQILAVGTMVYHLMPVVKKLSDLGIEAAIVNARFVKPMDTEMLSEIASSSDYIFTAEENQLAGGFGQGVATWLFEHSYSGKFKSFGIPDRFVQHGTQSKLLIEIGLGVDEITDSIVELVSSSSSHSFFNRLRLRKNSNRLKEAIGESEPKIGE